MQSSRERKKMGVSLLDGVHLVSAYHDSIGMPDEIIVSRTEMANAEIAGLLAGMPKLEPFVLSDGLFRELSSVATPTGILAVIKTPRSSALPAEPETCLLLEDLQDPGNLGSILRSAAAADVNEIYLSKQCVNAWSPRVLRAGMGAHFRLRIYENVDLDALASRYDGRVIAMRGDAKATVFDTDLTGRVALIFGNEGTGISAALLSTAQSAAKIPMTRGVESLNVAAAAAVCLFERLRQQRSVSKSAA